MTWQLEIPGCFGSADGVFAGHPSEQAQARTMLGEALAAGASWQEVENAVRNHLKGTNCQPAHVNKQVTRARDLATYMM